MPGYLNLESWERLKCWRVIWSNLQISKHFFQQFMQAKVQYNFQLTPSEIQVYVQFTKLPLGFSTNRASCRNNTPQSIAMWKYWLLFDYCYFPDSWSSIIRLAYIILREVAWCYCVTHPHRGFTRQFNVSFVTCAN